MLIDPRKRIAALEKELHEVVNTTFEQPWGDYSLYLRAVGRYEGIKLAINFLKQDLDDGDDDA